MSNIAHIDDLMTQIGPLVEQIEVVQRHDETRWSITFDEETIVLVDYLDEARKLTFVIEIGPAEEEMKHSVYEFMLGYNYLYADTGGVRMAIDGPAGNVVQLFDLFETDLDINTLITVLENLVAKAWHRREMLSPEGVLDMDGLEESDDTRITV